MNFRPNLANKVIVGIFAAFLLSSFVLSGLSSISVWNFGYVQSVSAAGKGDGRNGGDGNDKDDDKEGNDKLKDDDPDANNGNGNDKDDDKEGNDKLKDDDPDANNGNGND